jgi:hypothetical protein
LVFAFRASFAIPVSLREKRSVKRRPRPTQKMGVLELQFNDLCGQHPFSATWFDASLISFMGWGTRRLPGLCPEQVWDVKSSHWHSDKNWPSQEPPMPHILSSARGSVPNVLCSCVCSGRNSQHCKENSHLDLSRPPDF